MKGLQFSFLAGIILVVVIVAVGFLFLFPLTQIDIRSLFGLQPILGTPGSGGTPSQNYPTFQELTIPHIISAEGQAYYAPEITCAVSNDIYDDFTRFGNAGVRENCEAETQGGLKAEPLGSCLVGLGSFNANINTITSQADIDSANSRLSTYQCQVSQGASGGFDEVELNSQFSLKTVGSRNFCTGQFSTSAGD